MNILFLTDELRNTSGVTTHLQNLLSGLSKHSICEERSDEAIPSSKPMICEERSDEAIPNSIYNFFLICGSISARDKFNDLHIPIIENSNFSHENRSLKHFFKALIFLRQFCKENKIDIIHSHTHYAANIAYHTSYTVKVRTIQTNHGILHNNGRLEHFKAHRYIAINEHIYDYLLNNNIAVKSQITFIRCGIPFPEHSPEKKISDKIKFIAASRFIHDKGLDIYIKAVSLLRPDYKQRAEFYLAGQGELENELLRQNEELRAGIIFLGEIKDIQDVLSQTHVFVNPSRGTTEGFPAVITEAAANDNLIITSDFRGLSAVFEDQRDGMIFKVDDEAELSEKLKYVIENYSSLSGAVQNFRNKVKELFNLEKMIEKHIELYKECLS